MLRPLGIAVNASATNLGSVLVHPGKGLLEVLTFRDEGRYLGNEGGVFLCRVG